jgi:hypothetical protein
LWNWSLGANHDVLALVSGLTLPPLALACLWALLLSLARLLAATTRRPAARRTGRRVFPPRAGRPAPARRADGEALEQGGANAAPTAPSRRRKLAA